MEVVYNISYTIQVSRVAKVGGLTLQTYWIGLSCRVNSYHKCLIVLRIVDASCSVAVVRLFGTVGIWCPYPDWINRDWN